MRMNRDMAGVAIALLIFAAVAILAYRSVDGALETLGWVEQTHETMRQLEELSSVYGRAVSGRRAYTVAGDELQLADVSELGMRLASSITRLRERFSGDRAQLVRLNAMSSLIDERIAMLDASVERRRHGEAAPETAAGLAVALRIRDLREEMQAAEGRLLAERGARTQRDMNRTKIADVLGTLTSCAIVLLAFRRLREEVERRRRSEHAVRVGERFLDSIVENIPNMIFVKEARDLRFERINRAGEKLLGIRREDLSGKNDFDFFPSEQAEFFQARDRATLAEGAAIDIPEEPIQTAHGERWLHTKKVPVRDENGTPRFLLGISEDITESRQVAAALKAAKEAAMAANQELEAFSYSVAHDLRAPLRSIDGFSQAILEDYSDRLDGDGRRHLERVRKSAQDMAELIDGLLSLSRVTRSELVRERVDLSRLARESGARLVEAHPDRRVDLIVEDGLVAEADARLLTAAFDNLLGNAWKFSSQSVQARVEVGRRIEQDRSVFFVRDNGAGFDPSYAHKLFVAFQRLHPTSEFEGSGIGLATVQRIIRRHGGTVWAEGEIGRGASFYFTL